MPQTVKLFQFQPGSAASDSVAVALVEPDLSTEVWTVVVEAFVDGGWVQVGPAVVTVAPSVSGSSGARIVALATMPGVLEWRATATPAGGGSCALAFVSGPAMVTTGAILVNVDPGAPSVVPRASAGLVLKPGGVASGNVVTTWAEVMAFVGVNEAALISLDASASGFAPFTPPPGVYNMRGATLGGVSPATGQATINVSDGVDFQNLSGITSGLVLNSLHTLTPALTWTVVPGQPNVFMVGLGANILNGGAVPAIEVLAGNIFVLSSTPGAQIGAGPFATPLVNVAATGVVLLVSLWGTLQANWLSGAVGSTLVYQILTSNLSPVPAVPLFLGAVLVPPDSGYLDSPSASVVWRPGGAATPFANVFTEATPDNAWAAFRELQGPKTFYMDASVSPVVFPAGIYNANAAGGCATLAGVFRGFVNHDGFYQQVPCLFDVGASLVGISEARDLQLSSQSAAPVVDLPNGWLFSLHNCTVRAFGGASFFTVAAGVGAEVDLWDQSVALASINAVFETLDATSILRVRLYDAAQLESGTTVAFLASILQVIATTNAVTLGTLGIGVTQIGPPPAAAVPYVDTVPLLGSSNTQGAIDALKTLASVPVLSHLRYVDKGYTGGDSNGSISRPYVTIQDAIDAVVTVPAQNKIWWGVLVTPGDYDEDISFDGTNRQIAILGLGPWGLGTFDGVAGAPTGAVRNINWTISGGNVDGTQHALMVGQYQGPNLGISTHIAIESMTRISGVINVIDDVASGGSSKTLVVSARVFDAAVTGVSIDATLGTAPSIGAVNLWSFASRFETWVQGPPTLGGPGILLQWAENTRFTGLINAGRYSRMQNCLISGGMTITTDLADTQPSGMVNCNFSGVFTGPAASLRMDANTNYWFKLNAAGLGGAATKTIQDDLIP